MLMGLEFRYLFIFSLATRKLLQDILIPHTTNARDKLLLTRLNATHLLTVSLTWAGIQCANTNPGPKYATARFRLNTYPIDGTSQSKHAEILISDPSNVHLYPSGITMMTGTNQRFGNAGAGYRHEWPLSRPGVAFHVGKVWFPYLPNGTISATPKDDPD